MKGFTVTKTGRTLLLAAVMAVGVVCLVGCGGDDNPTNNNGNNNNGGGSVPIEKWMKENLNVETEDSWCYDNDPANCAKYGRLYTWESAKAACLSIGKRLPTREEWAELVEFAGGENVAGKKLKARSGWNNDNGTDNYGFAALPGGACGDCDRGSFSAAGVRGFWWTATAMENDGYGAYIRGMGYGDGVYEGHDYGIYGFSVRCVEK